MRRKTEARWRRGRLFLRCFAAIPHPSAALTPSPVGKALGAAAPVRRYGGLPLADSLCGGTPFLTELPYRCGRVWEHTNSNKKRADFSALNPMISKRQREAVMPFPYLWGYSYSTVPTVQLAELSARCFLRSALRQV